MIITVPTGSMTISTGAPKPMQEPRPEYVIPNIVYFASRRVAVEYARGPPKLITQFG